MTKEQSGSVTVRLGTLRKPLVDYCEENGLGLSDGLRKLIGETLAKERPPGLPVSFSDEPGDKLRLELRLTVQEHQAIQSRVVHEGFTSANRWVVSLIRANLQKEPEFGETGLDALYESNRLLAPLARNLNQLARDIHLSGLQVPAYRFQILENLQKIVQAHIKVIAQVISRNVGRWRSE